MPQLAAFPKAYMDALCVTGEMTIAQWVALASELDVPGMEFYAGFLELADERNWSAARQCVEAAGMCVPMLCCSPDFTHPDEAFRRQQLEQQQRWIDMAAALGAGYCRVLSGQRRPEVSREQGLQYAAECIEAAAQYAAPAKITLILENHYKDNYWQYPEFAQHADVFCDLVDRITAPNFGVNYDPSNTLLAGEDPLELLERVKLRVVTMHASDRYLIEGTLEDLRREEDSVGYARRLQHGTIGQGLNDYDAIFRTLRTAGFDGWISIEDGVDGFEQLQQSVAFLKQKIHQHWL